MCSFIREKNTKILCYVQYRPRAVSFFLQIYWGECLSRLALSVTRVDICVSRAFCSTGRCPQSMGSIMHVDIRFVIATKWRYNLFYLQPYFRHYLFINFLFCFLLLFFFQWKILPGSLFLVHAVNSCLMFVLSYTSWKWQNILCKSVKWWEGLVAEINYLQPYFPALYIY